MLGTRQHNDHEERSARHPGCRLHGDKNVKGWGEPTQHSHCVIDRGLNYSCEPGSKLLVLGMVIQPLIGNPYNGYINPYYWVDDRPLLYGNIGSLDPSTCSLLKHF